MYFFRTDHLRLSVWEVFFMLACINTHLSQYNLVESAALGRIGDTDEQPTGVCRSYCKTPTCLNDAKIFRNYLNTSVNPCDNFYEFACGGFMNKVQMSAEANVVNLFSIVQSQVSTELYNEIRQGVNLNDIDAFKKVKTYYSNCMNLSNIRQEGTEPMFKLLNAMGGWPVLLGDNWDESNFSWTESIYKLQDHSFPLSFPVQLVVYPDQKNSSVRILKVVDFNTVIDKSYFMAGLSQKKFKNYYRFMRETATALGANEEALNELIAVVEFETNLFKIQITTEEASEKSIDNLMSVRELAQNYSSIPWLKLFNRILQTTFTIDENEIVSVIDLDYLGKVEKLLQVTPKRVLANYLAWTVACSLLDYMPSELEQIKLNFNNALAGTTTSLNRESKCLSDVVETFPIAVSSLYIKKYFNNTEIKKSVYELVQDIKSETKRKLEQIDWMDEKTRQAALRKLAAMTVNPGYADELLSEEKINEFYKDLEINPGSYLSTALNSTSFLLNNNYKGLREPVDKNDWTMHPSSVLVNAFYMLQTNNIEIPGAILRGLFFKIDRPKYLNYGAIGTIIGHEITHAFDNSGRKFDEKGNFVNWWQAETEKRFLNKVQCIIDQYSNFTVQEVGMNVNGVLTQGENIADNGGFKAAYHAYNEWVSRNNIYEDCLPSLNYSPRQMFWISAASVWCTKQRPEYLENIIAKDAHSPGSTRIIVSFSNMKEFAEDFQCDLGTRMNPEKKCIVW